MSTKVVITQNTLHTDILLVIHNFSSELVSKSTVSKMSNVITVIQKTCSQHQCTLSDLKDLCCMVLLFIFHK